VDQANDTAVKKLMAGKPVLIGMGLAGDVIPNMTPNTILHAGPPITWEKMSGPLRAAIQGALVFEGLAPTLDAAEQLSKSGDILFKSGHDHQTVGPMAGVTSYSMPVFIIENKTFNNSAFCTLNEGLGKVLRYGANNDTVIQKLHWLKQVVYPTLKKALDHIGGIELKPLIAQALHMGDECHNRNKAATSLLIRTLLPAFLSMGFSQKEVQDTLTFINGNDHFFLNLSMPAAKSCLDASAGVKDSSLITVMARNGTDFGIRVSGCPGKWFTAPANIVKGLLFPGYSQDDCNPDIGDSAITETFGIGGFAMAASPAITQFIGGTPEDALAYTQAMYSITLTENPLFSIPNLGFRGAPTGIDLRKVIQLNELPIINTGISHKTAGIGMVGAGIVYPPMACFEKALITLFKP
jgi:hypothetical protein